MIVMNYHLRCLREISYDCDNGDVNGFSFVQTETAHHHHRRNSLNHQSRVYYLGPVSSDDDDDTMQLLLLSLLS